MEWVSELASIEVNFEHLGNRKIPLFIKSSEEGGAVSRAAIVYGRNGAGKSSLARALDDRSSGFQAFDLHGNRINLDNATGIHVFDQSFIDQNFRQIGDEGLAPVILLGEQVDNQREIEDCQKELNRARKSVRNIKAKLPRREKSVERAQVALTLSLRGSTGTQSGSWAGRASDIHGKNKKVTEAIRQQIISANKPTRPIEEIAEEFKDTKKKLELSEESAFDNFTKPKEIPSLDFEGASSAIARLDSRGESASDDELTTRIRENHTGLKDLRSRVVNLFSPSVEFCPNCYQDLPQNHKERVLPLLDALINELEVDSDVQALTKFEANWTAKFPMPKFAEIPEALKARVSSANETLEKLKNEFNGVLKQKVDNPRAKVKLDSTGFETALSEWQSAIKEVENYVHEHNSVFAQRTELIKRADALNLEIAILESQAQIAELSKAKLNHDKKCNNLRKAEADVERLNNRIEELKLENSGESAGADKINEMLRVIFGEDGIQLSSTDRGYLVLNRDHTMTPGRLSTGETNALALSYFFVRISAGDKFENGLKKSHLVVLDDPISSFDLDNRYGVTALIGFMARKILATENRSKLLILTHDPSVAYDLSKILNAILSGSELSWEFSQGEVTHKDFSATDVYKNILQRMVDTICRTDARQTLTANEVRRVWEAFVTFELGETTTDASTSAKVQKFFEEMGEDHERFLDQYPSRVFINPDSHAATQLSYFNFGLRPAMEPHEFKRFVRDTLCFMHMVSPYHIASRIGKDTENRAAIKAMLDEEVNNLLNLQSDISIPS